MSKVKIEGNASGTGTLTISAPNTNTDRALTLPDGAGEILTDASSLPAANLTGTLPAIDGSSLTGVGGIWEIAESWTPTAVNSKDFTLDFDTYSEYRVAVEAYPLCDTTANFVLTFLADSGATAMDNIAYTLLEGTTDITPTATASAAGILLVSSVYGWEDVSGNSGQDFIEAAGGFVTIRQHTSGQLSTSPYNTYNNKSYTYGEAQFFNYLKPNTTDEPAQNRSFKYGARANAATDPLIDTLRFYWAASGTTPVFNTSGGSIILYGLKRS